jgi:hypothetical protein
MLSDTAIKAILQDGSYFKDEFDFETNRPKTTDEVKDWFAQEYGIKNRDSAFVDFYNLVGAPPVGNGPDLFDLESIDKVKENFSNDLFILIASGDTGAFIYDISNDKVYEYDFLVHSYSDLDDATVPCMTWNSFSEFLDAYYQER